MDAPNASTMRMFEPGTLPCGLVLKNRIWRSATWMAEGDETLGVTDWLVGTYRKLGAGGPGMVVTGFTDVSRAEGALEGGVGLWSDEQVAGHRRLVDAVHGGGAWVLSQLACVNAQAEPDDLTAGQIHEIERWFVTAATRAQAAGYDGVQIHLAHFFFLSRFVSPACNHRTDRYGGSAQGRARIAVEILRGIRTACGSTFAVAAKVNCMDFVDGGTTLEDFLALGRTLDAAGIDAIEVSANGTSVAGVRAGKGEAYFLKAAELLKGEVSCPVVCVGGFRSPEVVEDALSRVDYVSMSRPLVREPGLVVRWESGDLAPSACISCNACYRTPGHRCRFV